MIVNKTQYISLRIQTEKIRTIYVSERKKKLRHTFLLSNRETKNIYIHMSVLCMSVIKHDSE